MTMATQTFIGLDLAWKVDANHSGIVVLYGDAPGVHLKVISEGIDSQDGVVQFIVQQAQPNTFLAIESTKQCSGRWLFEVCPHPAMVRLFRLNQIIRYKMYGNLDSGYIVVPNPDKHSRA